METVLDYSVEFLKVHPRNNEFYDDISGEDYEQFKATIQNEGVLTPLIVAPDMTVISGHQRLKVCKDLGFETVPIIIRQDIKTEEDKMAVLLATNYGRPDSAKKKRKIADEYVRLKGLRNGQKLSDNRKALTQKDIAKELGISVSTLNEMLDIERKLTPELKEMLDAGIFTETTASKILVKLTPEEQADLITTYGKEIIEGVTQKQMQEYVDKLKAIEEEKTKEIESVRSNYELQIANIMKQSENDADDKLEEIIKERDELKQKYRNQYEATQQLKNKLEEAKEDVRKSKEYKDLLAQVNDHKTHLDNLNRLIREQEEQLVVLKKSRDDEDYYNANVGDVKKPDVENVTFDNLFSRLSEYVRFTNIYTFGGVVYERIDDDERKKLFLIAVEALENTNKILSNLKGSK